MSALKKICRLCLEKCENFEAIDENTKILLPRIDFTAIQEPVMCKNCAGMVKKCFDFKVKCLRTHNYIVPFINKDNIELDLRDVYLSKNVTSRNIPEDEAVCGLCMDLVKNCAVVPLDVEEKDVVLWKMIEQYLPELDLSIVKKAVICPSCCGSLKDCFRFVTTCLVVEQEIKKYHRTLCSSSKDQNELNSTSQLVDGNSVGTIKVEKELREDRKGANENVQNKNESYVGFDDQKVKDEQQFTPSMYACEEENNKIKIEKIFCEENEPWHGEENLTEVEDQKVLVPEENAIKTDTYDFNSFRDAPTSSQSITENINRCYPEDQEVIGQTLSEIRVKHLENMYETKSTHNYRNPPGYNCPNCLFVTKHKASLTTHILNHRELSEVKFHMCEICFFVTAQKHNFNSHMLVHRELLEITVYTCESCSFTTKHKESLESHMLTHRKKTEVTVYACESCSYVTIRKYNLKSHMLTHREPSEVFRCQSCSYIAKRKENLKSHMLTHRELSEVTVYRCENCSYVTKRRTGLIAHMLTHRELSEVTVYRCESCSFITKHKTSLKEHMLTHRRLSEVTVHACKSCSFVTKHKSNMKSHMVTHRELSELRVYLCESCSYVTKRKTDLKSHMLTHRELSEIMVYRCESCSYVTKRKTDLKSHMLTHRGLLEITAYRCSSCSYVTKRKGNLKTHMLTHRELSDVKIYRCKGCSYVTKFMGNLKIHNKRIHQCVV